MKSNSQSIEIYIPEDSSKSLNSKFDLENKLVNNKDLEYAFAENKKSLNELLCVSLGYDAVDLPWNQLRAMQFELERCFFDLNKKHTLVCCDPVMMQVTHRGAYLWGQDSIKFSTEDVIAIIAQINEKLMDEGEFFYLLNNKQWLYVNKKSIELNQASFENEIGRDQFAFSYQGKESRFWNRLATEIQMLVKQMIDYQGLTNVGEESLVNVHFWGDTNNQLNSDIKIKQSSGITIFSNNDLIKTFADKVNVECEKLISINELVELRNKTNIVIHFSNDGGWLGNIMDEISSLTFNNKNRLKVLKLILQDKTIEIKPKRSFFQRLFN
ncbi:MAG: hypothetical protein COB38_01945 [Gammaproteobacteria bacterium]|nr:MAG: hypothetical protein COB38_01945 [Gammaproteobacteria bacterium]